MRPRGEAGCRSALWLDLQRRAAAAVLTMIWQVRLPGVRGRCRWARSLELAKTASKSACPRRGAGEACGVAPPPRRMASRLL